MAIARTTVVPVTDALITTVAQLRAACRHAGHPLADHSHNRDLWIAASGDLEAIDVNDLLAGLVDQSMVLVERGPFGRRFRLLESMRQLGPEHLSASGEDNSVAERHARWCVEQVARIHQLLAGPAEIEGVARLSELWPNLRAAVDRACVGRDSRLDRYGEPDHPLIHQARALVYQDFEALLRWCPLAAAEQRRSGDDLLAEVEDIGVGRALLALGGWRWATRGAGR